MDLFNDLGDMSKPFQTLGLEITASEEEINRQRRRLVLKVHPDKTRGDNATKRANEAKTRLYNRAHEEAISLIRNPLFQQIKANIQEKKKLEEEIKKKQEEHKREEDATQKRVDKKHFYFKMIDIIINESKKLDDDYNETEFKEKIKTWTHEQHQEASDAVQYGLGDSSKMLNEQRCKLEEVIQENVRLKTQIQDLQTETNEKNQQLTESREQLVSTEATLTQKEDQLRESEQIRINLDKRISVLQSLLEQETNQKTSAEAGAKEWEHKYNEMQQQKVHKELVQHTRKEMQSEIEDTSNKKRKHTKRLDTKEIELAFKNRIASFLQTRFQVGDNAFLSTKKLQRLFIEHTGQTSDDQLFFKTLRTEMRNTFPAVTPCERRISGEKERGYLGIQQSM